MTFAETEAAEIAIIAEIGALGERELTAVKAWIASGCEGPQPRPDTEARVLQSLRMVARQGKVRACGGAKGCRIWDAI